MWWVYGRACATSNFLASIGFKFFEARAESPLIIMMMIVITITMMIMRETFVLGPLWFNQK